MGAAQRILMVILGNDDPPIGGIAFAQIIPMKPAGTREGGHTITITGNPTYTVTLTAYIA